MTADPYRPPRDSERLLSKEGELRHRALTSLRWAAVLLLGAAAYNYVEFDLKLIAESSLPRRAVMIYRAVNLCCFAIGFVLIWKLALPLLEGVALLLRKVFASQVDPEDWLAELYRVLTRAVPLASAGAILWAIWVYAYYRGGVQFGVISWIIGVSAHLLAAGLYVPLLLRWYHLRRREDETMVSEDHDGSA